MDLSELSASELARIDSICLGFESELRSGKTPSIEALVETEGGEHPDLLRQELLAIQDELSAPSLTLAGSPIPKDSGFAVTELPSSGTTLGHYVLGEMIGRGGMGVVYKATDPRLGRDVAIKMLTVDAAQRRELTERFEREAKALAALSHPNIVELFDIGVHGGLPYVVMEYLDGELLDGRFKQGRMCPETVRHLGSQVADALATAHAGGVIHRDLKPHNIMLVQRKGGHDGDDCNENPNESTIVKLFDFGLSRVPRDELDGALETAEGIILGTPGYMAPEQARGEMVTSGADLFALGCVLFEAFYGKRAFDGDSTAARFKSTIEDIPEIDPIRRRDDVALSDLIEHCLQKDPAARPESAALVAKLLRIRPKPPCGEAAKRMVTRRRLLIGTGMIGIGGLAFALLRSGGTSIPKFGSLAVLRIRDETAEQVEFAAAPIGDRKMDRGEQLSAILVDELSRVPGLMVPRYRSISADSPDAFRELAEETGVEAFITGSIRRPSEQESDANGLFLQLISGQTGLPLWEKEWVLREDGEALEQSRVASEIATLIGRRLTATADALSPPNDESFRCLVDGKVRSDPESVAGLEMALKCFERAHEVDQRFADPLAGIALTSVTLAAQSSPEKSQALIARARETAADALERDRSSIDARLASAMLDWQTTNRYEQAASSFRELSMVADNHWQVKYQYGLFLLATGENLKAKTALREASQLNPWSVLARVERARADWFSGNAEKAITEAMRLRDKHDQNVLARGLLVDIFESQKRFDLAIEQDPGFERTFPIDETDYFTRRHDRLGALPYGPFGEVMNRAILRSRTRDGISSLSFAEITDHNPPMLPFLLAAHPGFASVRMLERAAEILPSTSK